MATLRDLQNSLQEATDRSKNLSVSLDDLDYSASTLASLLLLVDEATSSISATKKVLQQQLVEALEGQRGEHHLRGGLVAEVTMRSAKRKFNDQAVFEQLRDYLASIDNDGTMDMNVAAIVDDYSAMIQKAAYVSYWRTKALHDFDIDIDTVSVSEPGVPTVTVRRESNDA